MSSDLKDEKERRSIAVVIMKANKWLKQRVLNQFFSSREK